MDYAVALFIRNGYRLNELEARHIMNDLNRRVPDPFPEKRGVCRSMSLGFGDRGTQVGLDVKADSPAHAVAVATRILDSLELGLEVSGGDAQTRQVSYTERAPIY